MRDLGACFFIRLKKKLILIKMKYLYLILVVLFYIVGVVIGYNQKTWGDPIQSIKF